jgi:lysylphosphatidylglycerol synthetase-like protein (DUF2156 family)
MPNLLPDLLPWIRPAGRLIWSVLITGAGLVFLAAVIRPPLERKIVTTRQALGAVAVVLALGVVCARFLEPVQTLVVWATVGIMVAIALAAVVSRDPRSPDRQTTWVEAMLGALGVFAFFVLVYGVIPHEWLTFANSYLNMSSDRFVTHPLDRYVKLPYSALRDAVAALIYVIGLGANVVVWYRWQDRLAPKPEKEPTEATVVRTSRFGRPLRTKV